MAGNLSCLGTQDSWLEPPSTFLVATEPIHAVVEERLALGMCLMVPGHSWTLDHTQQLLPFWKYWGG